MSGFAAIRLYHPKHLENVCCHSLNLAAAVNVVLYDRMAKHAKR